MNINQMLQQTGAVDAISRQLGVDPATAEAGATALLPSILSGFQNPVASSDAAPASSAFPGLGGGLGGLLGTIGGLGGAGLLENVTSEEPTQVDKGNQILGQLFGSKDGSRAVAASAAAESGVRAVTLEEDAPDPRDGRRRLCNEARGPVGSALAACSAAALRQIKPAPMLNRKLRVPLTY